MMSRVGLFCITIKHHLEHGGLQMSIDPETMWLFVQDMSASCMTIAKKDINFNIHF